MRPEVFLDEWYEKRPLHLPRNRPTWYEAWLTLRSFAEVLTRADAEFLQLKAVRNGASQLVPLQKALEAFAGGQTVEANRLHLLHPPMAALCRELEKFFYHPFESAVHLTPPRNRGRQPRFHVHDVFILQAHGARRWKVYDPPIELPLAEQWAPVQLDPSSAPVLDAVMQAGDMLYLPRGYVHEEVTAPGHTSLHLSLTLLGLTWRDALIMTVQAAARDEAKLRRTVPFGQHPGLVAQVPTALNETMEIMAARFHEAPLAAAEEAFVRGRPAVLADFEIPGLFAPIELESTVRAHPMVIFSVKSVDDHFIVAFHGKQLKLTVQARPMLDRLLAGEPVQVRDLPGADGDKLALARFLHAEGLLQRVAAPQDAAGTVAS